MQGLHHKSAGGTYHAPTFVKKPVLHNASFFSFIAWASRGTIVRILKPKNETMDRNLCLELSCGQQSSSVPLSDRGAILGDE